MLLIARAPRKRGQDPFQPMRSRKRVLTPFSFSNPFPVEFRFGAGPVDLERSLLADRVRPLEDPVLPRRQTPEDARRHGFRAAEAQARFHAGEGVRAEARALLDGDAQLVLPVDVVWRRGDETFVLGL